jgi:hypothetical protein
MDSNFQVKITADLGDLVAKIKNIETTLKKLDASFKTVGAKNNLKKTGEEAAVAGLDMNRMRLASFALGQVLRDSGFFAQSFGLGLLAISNNIPILIDQLVMLSGISKGLGAAISLAGSVLTAVLTVWAYSSMAIDRNTESLEKNKNVLEKVKLTGEDYYKTLNNLDQTRLRGTASAQSELTTLRLLYSQYTNLQLPLSKRKEAYDQMQQIYPSVFGNLKFENEITDKVRDAYNGLAQSIIASARARAAADSITKNAIRQYENEQQIIELTTEKLKQQDKAKKDRDKRLASGGDVGDIEITNVELTRKEKLQLEEIDKIQKAINDKKTDSAKLIKQNIFLETLYNDEVKKGGKITDETVKGDGGKSKLEGIRDVYIELAKELKKIEYDILSSDLEKANSTLEAHKKSLESLLDLGVSPLSKGYKDLQDSMLRSMKALNDQEGKLFAAKLLTSSTAAKAQESAQKELDAKKKQAEIEKQLSALGTDSLAGELTDDPTNAILEQRNALFLKQIKNINDTKSLLMDMGNILVGPLAGAFETMMQTGEFSFKAIIKSLGQVIAKLMAAIAAAAILAIVISIATGGAAGGGKSFSTAFSGLMSGKGMFPGLKFANGGIVSGPTSALIGEYPGARNNPEVVAPLDKLKSLIGDSGAGSSGGFTGQLETRISGNDLVILMNRANKNRNGYY